MFDDGNIIAGLEIGTSKICVVVGELANAAINFSADCTAGNSTRRPGCN